MAVGGGLRWPLNKLHYRMEDTPSALTMGTTPMSYSASPGILQAERELRPLRKHGLTPAGERWLVTALDPYHDRAIEVDGYPDYNSTSTITQIVKRSITITDPNPADSTPWAAHIFSTQVLANSGETATTIMQANQWYRSEGNTAEDASIGTVTVYTTKENGLAPEGQTALWHTPPDADGVIQPGAIDPRQLRGLSPVFMPGGTGASSIPDRRYCNGSHRLIGMGVEGIDTTPVLRRGGLATVYRQNVQAYQGVGLSYDDPSLSGMRVMNMRIQQGPPATVSDALLLPGTRQWSAEQGFYIVPQQQDMENPFVRAYPTLFGIGSQPTTPGTNTLLRPDIVQTNFGPMGGGLGAPNQPKLSYSEFGMCGVMLTNLPPGNTFTINARFIIERAPTALDYDLMPLARPSPEADLVAWAVYSEAMRRMPPGVILADNMLGTWFKGAVAAARRSILPGVQQVIKAAAPVAKPIAKAAARRAGVAERDIDLAEQVLDAVKRGGKGRGKPKVRAPRGRTPRKP